MKAELALERRRVLKRHSAEDRERLNREQPASALRPINPRRSFSACRLSDDYFRLWNTSSFGRGGTPGVLWIVRRADVRTPD